MAFQKKTWTDRQTQYPNKRTLTPVSGENNAYTVARAEGDVFAEGDKFDADTMNDFENRIETEFSEISASLKWEKIGQVTGQTEITINNTNINDIYICVFAAGINLTISFPYVVLGNSYAGFNLPGTYLNANSNISGNVLVSKTKIKLNTFTLNGNDYSAGATVAAFCR